MDKMTVVVKNITARVEVTAAMTIVFLYPETV
jgi:hypothetical protein